MYLSGVICRPLLALQHEHIGYMLQPGMGNRAVEGAWCGYDNGAFAAKWNEADWLRFLKRHQTHALRRFAVAPDVFLPDLGRGDARATWRRSAPYLGVIRDLGYPAALVAQDGFEDTNPNWNAFDVLFLGASTAWKLSSCATDAVSEAKRRGKWVHMGRVNSLARLTIAYKMGCDSCDGTYMRGGTKADMPKLANDICRWLDETNGQQTMFEVIA